MPCLSLWWILSVSGVEKYFPQSVHSFFCPWVNMCLFRLCRFFSPFPQNPHRKVRTSEWVLMCSLSLHCSLKVLPHLSQTCLRRRGSDSDSCIRILCWMWIDRQNYICKYSKLSTTLKTASQKASKNSEGSSINDVTQRGFMFLWYKCIRLRV